MKKKIVLGLAALFMLTGCGTKGEDISETFNTLSQAVDNFNANDKTSLQMIGMFSSTYNGNTNAMSLSALYQRDKAENHINSVLSMSSNGTYMDYHYLTDDEHFIAYYQTGDVGSKKADQLDSADQADEAETADTTDTEQSIETTNVYSIDEETFNKSIGFGTIAVPFEQDDIKKVTTKENEETDSITWVFDLKANSAKDTAQWLLESINLIDTSSTEIDFKINSLECNARYTEEGSLSYLKYILDVVMTAENEDLKANYSITYIPTGTGDDVDISLPDMEQLEQTAADQEKAYNAYLEAQNNTDTDADSDTDVDADTESEAAAGTETGADTSK